MRKARLLIICDSADRLMKLRSPLNTGDVEITSVSSLQELEGACRSEHDLAIVDVQPARIREVLQALRANIRHAGISLLVEVSRVIDDPDLAGVLPKYRAMPCSFSELLALARWRINPANERENEHDFL